MNPNHEEKKVGPIIGILIILILLVVAAIYFWSQKLNHESSPFSSQTENSTSTLSASNTASSGSSSIDTKYGLDKIDSVNAVQI